MPKIKDPTIHGRYKHGYRINCKYTRVYGAWMHMRSRCNNPNHKNFSRYRGRGIKVCKRWDKFENFLVDMGFPTSHKHTIDRIKNNLGYSKSNCRWATQTEQCRNRSNSAYITYKGVTKLRLEWAESLGITPRTLTSRLYKLKWTVKKALTTPVDRRYRG